MAFSATASAAVINVPSAGNETIQQAINNATAGDTILVNATAYNVQGTTETVIVNKSDIIIRSVNGRAVIDANGADDHVFNITDQTNVTLQGFEIRDAHGTNQDVAGIYMYNASDCNISDNVVTNISAIGDRNFACGLYLESSNNNTFDPTVIEDINGSYAFGVFFMFSNSTSFTDTTIRNVTGFLATGISFGILDPTGGVLVPGFSNDNNFTDTMIRNVKGNMTAGISLIASNSNTFDPTEIEDVNGGYTAAGVYFNYYSNYNDFSATKVHNISSSLQPENSFGFYLMESSSNNVTDGEIFNCARGTRIDSGRYNTIERNIIRDNFDTGVLLDRDAIDTEIHTNCFINNTPQAMDNGTGNDWTGNYWSDYPVEGGTYNISGATGSKDSNTLGECPLGQEPPTPTQVPALTPIGMLALVCLLSVIAAMSIRIRKRK